MSVINSWHKGRLVQVVPTPKSKEDLLAWKITFYEGDNIGHRSNDVCVHFGKDGHLFLSQEDDGERSVYLYPSQVKKLRGLLRDIRQPPIPKFKARRATK